MARKRWLHSHQDLFRPLLPPTSLIFDNIAKEVNNFRDKKSYVPLHMLVQQPELVKGGAMKDYQVRPCHLATLQPQLIFYEARRTLISSMDV